MYCPKVKKLGLGQVRIYVYTDRNKRIDMEYVKCTLRKFWQFNTSPIVICLLKKTPQDIHRHTTLHPDRQNHPG